MDSQTNQNKQVYKMQKDGFDAIAKAVASIKINIPKTEVDMSGVVKAMDKTNACMDMMMKMDKKDEQIEIILKLE